MTERTQPSAPETFEVYANATADARFSEWLRDRTGDRWGQATRHRFVREMAADDVTDDVFRRYLLQDYAFVRRLVGAFGHAVGEAPTMQAQSRLVSFLGTLTADENDYFERSFDALDVPASTYDDPAFAEATSAFADLLGRASAGGYPELLAVLAPAEWVYLEWATAVSDRSFSRFYLEEWVALHANPEFESFVEWLRAELDREGAAASPRRRRRLADLFGRTVDLEVAFFDAAYHVERDAGRSGDQTGDADVDDAGRDDGSRVDGGVSGW